MTRLAAPRWWLLCTCLFGVAAGAHAQSDPDAAELREAEALLELDDRPSSSLDGGDDEQDGDAERRFTYGLSTTSWVTATGGAPNTDLYDDSGYDIAGLLAPLAAQTYPSISLSIDAEWEPVSWLLLRTLIDSQEIRDGETLRPSLTGITMGGEPYDDALGQGNYVRELSATASISPVSLELGRFRARIADGLVHDGFVTGVHARLDLAEFTDADLRFDLAIGAAGPRVDNIEANTLASLSADYNFTPFESVGLFVAASRDRSGELSGVLRSALAEGMAVEENPDALFVETGSPEAAPAERTFTGVLDACAFPSPCASEGKIAYLGARFYLLPLPGLSLRGTVALAAGNFRLDIARSTDGGLPLADEAEFKVAGWAGDLEAHHGLGRNLDLGVYAFLLSGDDPPGGDDDTYRAFIGLAPYWVWTSVFFSGGINQGLYPSRASAAGINGRGAAGLGSGLEYSSDLWVAEMRAFWLRALAAPPPAPNAGDGRNYGFELDLSMGFEPWEVVRLGAEVGMLLPGDFFAHHDVAYRAVGSVTLHYAD